MTTTIIILQFLAIVVVLAVAESRQLRSVEIKPRIVGGEYAKDGQFPYQVAIRKTADRSHQCGASIISERFLLSAAHCFQFEYSKPDSLYAVVGTVYPKENGVKYALDKISPHKKFDPNTIYNDIALLRTAEKIVYNNLVQPIALPTTNTPGNVAAYVSGWGITSSNFNTTDYMKFAKIHTLTHEMCFDHHKRLNMGNLIVETSLCAFDGNGNAPCTGDSGKFSTFCALKKD